MAFGNYQYNPYINPYSNPYNPQQFNQSAHMPMQVQQQTQPPMHNGFVWVDGIEEANSFYVAPNNAVQLWDKNAPTIYKKSADSTGKPSMQIFDLVERKINPTLAKDPGSSEFVLRSEFDDLKMKVESLAANIKESRDSTFSEEE